MTNGCLLATCASTSTQPVCINNQLLTINHYFMRVSVVLMGLVLGGCAATRYHYDPPTQAVPAAWKNAHPADTLGRIQPERPMAATTETPPQLSQVPAAAPWWAVFNDTTLTRLETQANALNFNTRAAVARVDQARAQLRIANAQRAPVVALAPSSYQSQLSALRPVQSSLIPAVGVSQTQFYVPFNVNYEVDLWGRLRRNAQAANASFQASEEDAQTVRLTVAADAADFYFNLRGLDAELLVLDSARQARRYNVQLTAARFQAGVDNEIGVRRAETELATVEASAVELRRQRAGLVASLSTLTGRPASSFVLPSVQPDSVGPVLPLPDRRPVQATPPGPLLPAPPVIPANVPAQLLARRPDLRRAERLTAAANLRAKAARLARLPTLQLNGYLGPQTTNVGDLPKLNQAYTYYVGGGFNIPIFDGGRLRGNQQLAEAQTSEVVANYGNLTLTAYEEVETALADVAASRAQLSARKARCWADSWARLAATSARA
ncbi:MAG: efflux transporter outer membrane subunit, partial [Hymenobacter sp.]